MPAARPNRSDFLVSTDWLSGHLGDPGVRVLDCRFYFDDADRGRRDYLTGHLPGAGYLDWTRDISERRGDLEYMVASPEKVKASMERLGIGDDTMVVGYDDEGGHYVSRLWLILRQLGHDTVRILEGGWVKWRAEDRPVRGGDESERGGAVFTPRPLPHRLLVDADEVLRRRDDANTDLVDVRRLSEFTGEEVRSRHGGHIPWAKWLFWQDNLNWDADRTFRSGNELQQRYEAAGVTPDRHVVTYCHGAVRAAHTAFTLTMLGYPNVQVYDGSWEDWGSRDDLPRATGETAVP